MIETTSLLNLEQIQEWFVHSQILEFATCFGQIGVPHLVKSLVVANLPFLFYDNHLVSTQQLREGVI